jgi:hypothetical protein
MRSSNWAIGESVVVKPGVTDPDTGRDIGGWQGRISAILDEAEILTIRWDSLTLKSIPPAHIAWSEEEGLSWHAYLEEHLVFPFAATVEEYQRGPVRQGARVTVLAVTFLDETYGTIVAVKHKHGVNELPLCDLKATEADAGTRQLVEDYAVWFANR